MSFSATFLFHGPLNDFLAKSRKDALIDYLFERNPSVKDAIEALGVPHPEVAGVLINGKPVDFQYLLQTEDKVEVFPKTENALDFKANTLQPPLPETIKFVLDVHLGKLAKTLRMLGFDTVYQNDYADKVIAALAQNEDRIVLTRDINLLKIKTITWGYWLRSQHLEEQLTEVIRYFELEEKFAPFTRCLECNGLILPVEKQEVLNELPPNTRKYFQEFYLCENCRKVYWKGSHFERMQQFIQRFSLK
ncbi:Mut7-C ubiquitin/RNAse domain-containing protein [Adhaeribacter sp. BT258]|uniref:Mut7-C ubiquitin/RNAse domain-containing protein n=1 Tax=Adhaeribacter terrigena TaxID=2793070 RepID=A0ABS1BZA8_9BACT|nr:Mut7-C RNAse domain-containing protein [Adhaeribacter terrigena]MBK0402419.1 Mut7-C ubiquitin/RNAse domain-containing protein [Adhaeribacter terrigena]